MALDYALQLLAPLAFATVASPVPRNCHEQYRSRPADSGGCDQGSTLAVVLKCQLLEPIISGQLFDFSLFLRDLEQYPMAVELTILLTLDPSQAFPIVAAQPVKCGLVLIRLGIKVGQLFDY